MRRDEAIRTFNETRHEASTTPTWRLKLRIFWAQRRTDHSDANLLRLIALQHELRHRPGANLSARAGPARPIRRAPGGFRRGLTT